MLAATMTTTLLINNGVYYLTQNVDKLANMRAEMKSQLKRGFTGLSVDDWKKIILEDELLSTCNYLSYVVNEVLRIDPSVRFSTIHEMAGECQIGQYKVLDGQRFLIYFHGLQNNPNQWIAPECFIPERFDPSSKYFLTPDGKRRHPMSFGPFLGGKRVCLGKTFAENIGKSILTILFTQLDFEFVDPEVKREKPASTFFHPQPTYRMRVRKHASSE